jgi:hypothetical protein
MKVRVIFDPRGCWCVEKKEWFNFSWVYVESFYYDTAKERALEYAKKLLNPEIIEVKND